MTSILSKENTFKNDIIFIDGMWGSGKSMIAPIIGAMEGVEKQKIEGIYEYLCILINLNKIEVNAAQSLLRIYADMSQYDNLVGREVNFRWHDDSGIRNNPNSFRYIKRLFSEEGNTVVQNINEKNLALNIMSHMIAQVSQPLLNAFGNRVKIIETVRHPIYMVQHWYSYFSRFDGEREFTLSFAYNKNKVPWFADNWKDKFCSMSIIDRSLYSIIYLYDWLFDSIKNGNNKYPNTLFVSFESFVMETDCELKRIEDFLGRSYSPNIKRTLKQQKIPRKQLSQGKGHVGYGWKLVETSSEKEEYDKQLNFILKKASDEIIEEFNLLIKKYNEKWPSILSHFH